LISIALAALAGILLTGACYTLARRFPDADLIQYSIALLGTPLGQIAGTICLFNLSINAGRSPAKISTIGQAAFGWGQPVAILLILVVVTASFLLVRRGLKTIGSLCEYGSMIAIVLVVVAGLTVLAKADWTNYTFFAAGWGPAMKGAFTLTGRFSFVWVILLLIPRMRDITSTRNMLGTMATILVVGLLMCIGTLPIALHGAPNTVASFIPSLQLLAESVWGANTIVLSAVVVIWMLGLALAGAVFYWLLTIALAETASAPAGRFLFPAGVAAYALAMIIWYDPSQTYAFIREGGPYFQYSAGVGVPLLLLLVAWLREHRPGRQTATRT